MEWSDAVEKGKIDKATVVQKLKQSIDGCNAAYTGSTSLHYGNLITYMRMLGLKPPSS